MPDQKTGTLILYLLLSVNIIGDDGGTFSYILTESSSQLNHIL